MLIDLALTPRRILHILRAPIGGLFRHVCDLVEEQARMGHEVGVICDAVFGVAAEEKFKRLSGFCALGVHRVPMSRTLGLSDIAAFAAIRRQVERLQPEVLHGHGAKGGAFARLMPRVPGRVALYTPHGGSLHYTWRSPLGALYLGLENILRRRSDGLLFESEFSAECYRRKMGKPACPTLVAPNGLGQPDFAPFVKDEPIYDAVFVGELRALKGVGTLIEAARQLSSQRPFRLAIVGAGSDEALFRAEVAAKGLEKNVHFLGHRPAREAFAQARIVVVPSLAESFPYVILEAIAAGRPVVATKVGGIPEIFGPYAGALVPPGNAVALFQAMRNMLERPIAARALAIVLKERAESLFSATHMARDITRFYGELARLQPGRSGVWPAVKPQETTAF